MQRDMRVRDRQAGSGTALVQLGDPPTLFGHGVQRERAGGPLLGAVEDGEQAVADEFEHVAPLCRCIAS